MDWYLIKMYSMKVLKFRNKMYKICTKKQQNMCWGKSFNFSVGYYLQKMY